MTHEQFEKAAQYWERKEQTAMPQEALKKRLPTTLPKTTPALWPLAPAITSAAPPLSTASMPSGFPLNGVWKRFCMVSLNLPPAPLRKGNIQAVDLHHSIGLSATPSSV